MRRPPVGQNVGRMRPILRVIAEITLMRRPQCVGRNAADYAPTVRVMCLNSYRNMRCSVTRVTRGENIFNNKIYIGDLASSEDV